MPDTGKAVRGVEERIVPTPGRALTRELAAGRTPTEEDVERQDELLRRLDWMREAMTVMYGRHERKKPRVAPEAMKELARLWSLEAGYRKPAGGGGERARAAGNGTLREVLRRFPGAEEALLEVAERIAREDEERRRAA